jgi:hypothetical protein
MPFCAKISTALIQTLGFLDMFRLLTGDAISATNTSSGPAPMQKISFGLTFG